MAHDATTFEPTYVKTPAETEAAVLAEFDAVESSYARSARASHSQYTTLAGLPDSSAPVLTELVPDTAEIGSEDFVISIMGEKFDEHTVIWWKDHDEPTTFVSENEVTTLVRPDTIASPELLPISVRNGAAFSNVLEFDFTAPAAAVKAAPKKKTTKPE
jgi:hypothetical protein